jgi:hypothetical protein
MDDRGDARGGQWTRTIEIDWRQNHGAHVWSTLESYRVVYIYVHHGSAPVPLLFHALSPLALQHGPSKGATGVMPRPRPNPRAPDGSPKSAVVSPQRDIGNFAIMICGLHQYAIGPTNHRHRWSHQS